MWPKAVNEGSEYCIDDAGRSPGSARSLLMKERRAPRAALVVLVVALVVMRSAIAGSIVRSPATTSKSGCVRAITMPWLIPPIPPVTAATLSVEGGSGITIPPRGMRSRNANNIEASHCCPVRRFHRSFRIVHAGEGVDSRRYRYQFKGNRVGGREEVRGRGAYVFITRRRQSELDKAKVEIGKNVTAVQGDVAYLDDLDRLYRTVKDEKGAVDIIVASAGFVERG